jgi:sugar transferase (PEP-CTERM/EpsH1 system associated)
MKRLLYIAHRLPYPPDKGERVRAYHQLRALAGHFEITLASLIDHPSQLETAEGLEELCPEMHLARAGGLTGLTRGAAMQLAGGSITSEYFLNRRLRKTVRDLHAKRPFDLAFGYCSSTLRYLQALDGLPRVMDLVDVDSEKWAGYARQARRLRRWLYAREAIGVRKLERDALRICQAVLTVSEAESALLGDETGPAGRGPSHLMSVPNGVDLEYFRPQPRRDAPTRALVFTGTMDYELNVSGVRWFAREVFPALRRRYENLRFVIVGRDPTAEVRRLADRPGVTVTGTVDDVRSFLRDASAAVVPLPAARGIQNKVLEAMAMARAVVASTPAAEGLDAEPGRELLLADTPDQWVAQVSRLLDDPAMRSGIEQAARTRVEQSYSWAGRLAPLVSLCRDLASGAAPAPMTPSSAAEPGGTSLQGTRT